MSKLVLHGTTTVVRNYWHNYEKTIWCHKPQAIENSFKRQYGEVEDNIIIYIERLKT